MTRRKKLTVSILVATLILLVVSGALVLYLYFEGKSLAERGFGIDDLPLREARFKATPTIHDCIYLVDKYAFVLRDYEKAISYGQTCLTLERQSEVVDYLIHFWLADLYAKTGEVHKAKSHLQIALRLDQDKRIETSGWIESSGLQAVYEQIPKGLKYLPSKKP